MSGIHSIFKSLHISGIVLFALILLDLEISLVTMTRLGLPTAYEIRNRSAPIVSNSTSDKFSP